MDNRTSIACSRRLILDVMFIPHAGAWGYNLPPAVAGWLLMISVITCLVT